MPLNSVQVYTQGLLNGIQAVGLPAPTVAYISPPVFSDAIDQPQIFIWGSRMQEKRKTLTSGRPGYKWLTWTLDVWVNHILDPNYSSPDSEFPALLDKLLDVLRSSPIPVALTDALTGQQSTLVFFGEDMTLDYATPRRLSNESALMWQSARIGLQAVEQITT